MGAPSTLHSCSCSPALEMLMTSTNWASPWCATCLVSSHSDCCPRAALGRPAASCLEWGRWRFLKVPQLSFQQPRVSGPHWTLLLQDPGSSFSFTPPPSGSLCGLSECFLLTVGPRSPPWCESSIPKVYKSLGVYRPARGSSDTVRMKTQASSFPLSVMPSRA